MKHSPLRECGYALGVVVLLVGLYVGSYYAMVEKWELRVGGEKHGGTITVVLYSFGDERAVWFFGLAHKVDAWLRPDMWGDEQDHHSFRAIGKDWGRKATPTLSTRR
jgi:hypothetical protein